MGSSECSVDDDEARAHEQNNVERRRHWLARLPKKYSPAHRPRYVLLNLDNICSSLAASRTLFQRVPGASCPKGLRVDFQALTQRLCWRETAAKIACQVATYSSASQFVARALENFGWTIKPVAGEEKAVRKELMAQLDRGRSTNNEKTLVLAMGDGGLGVRAERMTAYREVICKFLQEGWFVEIHSWLYALNDGFIEFQVQYPGRVVVKPLDDVIADVVVAKTWAKSPRVRHKPVAAEPAGELAWRVKQPLADCNADHDEKPGSPAAQFPLPLSFPKSPPATTTGASYRDKVLCGQSSDPMSPSTTSTSSMEGYLADISAIIGPCSADKVSDSRDAVPTTPPSASSTPASLDMHLPGSCEERTPLYARSAARPAAVNTFVPPLPPTPPPAVAPATSSWMIQQQRVQQMQAMVAAQQADLALRQFILQQNLELMRFMETQEKSWGAATPPPPPANVDPWSNATRF